MDSIKSLLALKSLLSDFKYQVVDSEIVTAFEVTPEIINRITELEKSNIEFDSLLLGELFVDLNELPTKIGSIVTGRISLETLKSKGLNVYHGWKDLLSYKPNLTKIPVNFLILSERVVYPNESPCGKIKHYKEICEFLNVLISNSDHKESLTVEIIKEIIYLHKSRIEIPLLYEESCLGEGLDGISVVLSMFNDSSHIDQKNSILKEVLYSLLINVKKSERLEYLLLNFGEFSKRINENYQLFVSEFSFDDVRKEYEEKKRDYFSQLNDVFSSVQVKMLGIPISLALASLKMSAIVDDVTFWTNFFLALSIIIYSMMMFMLITNQKHTLSALKNEYEGQMARLKHQYSDQYDEIIGILSELNTRYDYQKTCLNWFYVMTAALFLLVMSLFTWNLPWKLIVGIA